MSASRTTPESPIVVEGLGHSFGRGSLRKQVLFNIDVEIEAGEIVIFTGPSGSGKSTLLTLVGALRSAQEGSLRVLGQELRDAGQWRLRRVRRQIGYIFQAHNLIDALTARENVQMASAVGKNGSRIGSRRRARELLEAVGLGDRLNYHPDKLSGGQRQRVAVARALAGNPRIILADEPTASLDKKSGRDVVDLLRSLSREQGVTVLLVTHDNRILDIADRIVQLEDGRLTDFTDAVIANTRQMMHSLAEIKEKEDLSERVEEMDRHEFTELLEEFTEDSRRFLETTRLANDEAFESLVDQALRAFTYKLGQLLNAERASLFVVDRENRELWLRVAQEERSGKVDLRIPIDSGIAGHVATTGESVRIDDAYSDPRFNPEVDRQTGFRTRSILCLPIENSRGEVFAVSQLLNRADGEPFDQADELRFAEFVGSIGVLLEAWSELTTFRQTV
jgi:putative ABC transport system ATP-binding protein